MYDIVIIGGGPAGLTAGIYVRRANKRVLVLEAMVCGGQIVNTSKIENYPVAPGITGPEFGKILQKQAEDLGVEIEFERAKKITGKGGDFTVTTAEDEEYKAKAVILACGTEPRKLGLPNEDRFTGRGISYCATCDGNFYKDKVVAVNGGGNSALHEAIYLSGIAKKVYLIHRRNEFRGGAALVDKVKARDNIELVLDANISALEGDKKLTGIKIDQGGKEKDISVDGLFVSIGRAPNAKKLLSDLALTKDEFVAADETCETNISGVFVAGDVRSKDVRQLVTATGDGAVAATVALQYLDKLD